MTSDKVHVSGFTADLCLKCKIIGVFATYYRTNCINKMIFPCSFSVGMSTTGDKILDTALSKVRLVMIVINCGHNKPLTQEVDGL